MKRNKWWIIGCIVFGVLFYTLPMTPLGYMIAKKETLTNRIMMKVARQITTEKELYLIGTGAQMMNEIQMLALSFDGFRDVSLDEARELIVYAVETFVNEVNANEKTRPYLANYPFTAKNIEIRIWFYNNDYTSVGPNHIFYIFNNRGKIEYYPGRPAYDLWNPMLVEKYDESLKILTTAKDKALAN